MVLRRIFTVMVSAACLCVANRASPASADEPQAQKPTPAQNAQSPTTQFPAQQGIRGIQGYGTGEISAHHKGKNRESNLSAEEQRDLSELMQLKLEEKRAMAEFAAFQVKQAERTLEILKKMKGHGALHAFEMEQAKDALEVAKGVAEPLEKQVQQAESHLSRFSGHALPGQTGVNPRGYPNAFETPGAAQNQGTRGTTFQQPHLQVNQFGQLEQGQQPGRTGANAPGFPANANESAPQAQGTGIRSGQATTFPHQAQQGNQFQQGNQANRFEHGQNAQAAHTAGGQAPSGPITQGRFAYPYPVNPPGATGQRGNESENADPRIGELEKQMMQIQHQIQQLKQQHHAATHGNLQQGHPGAQQQQENRPEPNAAPGRTNNPE